MTSYKHTQFGYLMLIITLVISVFFVFAYITARAEIPSVDSGTNLLITSLMILIVFVLLSFITLTVSIDRDYVSVKFGYGIFRKKFLINEIISVRRVRNHWYYGWGIRFWLWPKMWIYNISGFDAVEIFMKNGNIYRIGTDNPNELESAINRVINKSEI